jgi:DNA-binding NtrC family response regulator
MEPVAPAEHLAKTDRNTVLVVEDDFLSRWRVADYLREAGYRVIEAATANEAIVVLSCSKRVDLVFSNINLPGELSGHSLARWVAKYYPGLPMLLTSGDPDAPALISSGATRSFLPKPYVPEDVSRRIEEMLSRN